MIYLLVFGIAAVLVAIVWFFFMAPLEKDYHDRKLEMIRKKIEQREQRAGHRVAGEGTDAEDD